LRRVSAPTGQAPRSSTAGGDCRACASHRSRDDQADHSRLHLPAPRVESLASGTGGRPGRRFARGGWLVDSSAVLAARCVDHPVGVVAIDDEEGMDRRPL
jgi:hypothetical protein